MTARTVLAIDAGQTGMKLRLRTGSTIEDALLPGIRTHEPLLPQLAGAVRYAVERWQPGAQLVVAAGVVFLGDQLLSAAIEQQNARNNFIKKEIAVLDARIKEISELKTRRCCPRFRPPSGRSSCQSAQVWPSTLVRTASARPRGSACMTFQCAASEVAAMANRSGGEM